MGKNVPVLGHHAMKAYGKSDGEALRTHKLGIT